MVPGAGSPAPEAALRRERSGGAEFGSATPASRDGGGLRPRRAAFAPNPGGGRVHIAQPRGYTRSFWRACFLNILLCGGTAAFLLFPEYLDQQRMPEDQIGLVEATFWLTSMGVQPWLGRRLDVQGRRRFIVAGSFLMAAVCFSYLAVPVKLSAVAPLRGLQGLATAMYLTALTAWISDHAPPGRLAEFLGIFGVTGLLGATLGPLSGEFAFKQFGYPGLLLGSGAVSLVGAALTPTLRDQLPEVHVSSATYSYWQLAMSPVLLGTLVGSLAFGLATGSVVAFVAPFLADRQLPGVGVLLAVYALASGATRVYASQLTDRLGPHKAIGPALVLQAGAMVCLSFLGPTGWRAMPLLLLSAFLGGTGHGMVYPALSALAVLRLGSQFAGTGMSVVAASVDLGSSLGAFAAGQIVLRAGYSTMFVAMGAVVAGAAILFPVSEARSARARLEGPLKGMPREEA